MMGTPPKTPGFGLGDALTSPGVHSIRHIYVNISILAEELHNLLRDTDVEIATGDMCLVHLQFVSKILHLSRHTFSRRLLVSD